MTTNVCTLFEGHYHYGLGALVNSLYQNGFRGVIWAGYRGELPPWAAPLRDCADYQEYDVADGCVIRFAPVQVSIHLTNYKPTFMLGLWRRCCPDTTALAYFDPDITLRCPWAFVEKWVHRGIALCEDVVFSGMSANHPIRLEWTDFLESSEYNVVQDTNKYFNAGFIGVRRDCRDALEVWRNIINLAVGDGADENSLASGLRSDLWTFPDQDALNIMAMVTPHPLSVVGPEGMDFLPSGFIMSHATGTPKPWRKRMLRSALGGTPPSLADKGYWRNSLSPIRLYSSSDYKAHMIDLRLGAAIGRFNKRS